MIRSLLNRTSGSTICPVPVMHGMDPRASTCCGTKRQGANEPAACSKQVGTSAEPAGSPQERGTALLINGHMDPCVREPCGQPVRTPRRDGLARSLLSSKRIPQDWCVWALNGSAPNASSSTKELFDLRHDVDSDRLAGLAVLALHVEGTDWQLQGIERFQHLLLAVETERELIADQVDK